MSTRIMSECWPLVMSPTQKSVLISLADQANDAGVCWPSVASISVRTCLSERSVRKTIGYLAKAGFLTIHQRNGSSNYYTVTPARGAAPEEGSAVDNLIKSEAETLETPAPAAPLHELHPCTSCTPPRHEVHPPPAPDAGDPCTSCTQNRKEPSINRNEPSGSNDSPAPKKKRVAKKSPAFDFSHWPSDPSPEVLADWITVRKEKRAKLTQSAVDLMATHLHTAARYGFGVDYCLKVCCFRGWVGFKFDWLRKHEESEGRSIGPPVFEPERPLLPSREA